MRTRHVKPLARRLRLLWSLVREAFVEWNRDNAMNLAAMLAFYMVFSFAPILIFLVAVVSSVFGREAVKTEVVSQLQGILNRSSSAMVQTVLQNARQASTVATLIGSIAGLFGATMVFVALQDALNTIWGVTVKSGNVIRHFLRKRLISFLMLLVIGMIFLLSTIAGAALTLAGNYVRQPFIQTWILHLGQFGISVVLSAVLFGIIYRVLPDVNIAWDDVWIGALVTSILFNLGRMLIALYLAKNLVVSLYGTAGSFAVFLIWIYYSAQVFFFGAEFTQVYARKRGSPIRPDKNAVVFRIEKYTDSGQGAR